MNQTQKLYQKRIDYMHEILVYTNKKIRMDLYEILHNDDGSKNIIHFRIDLTRTKDIPTRCINDIVEKIINDKSDLIIVAHLSRRMTGNIYVDFTIYRDYYDVPWYKRWFSSRRKIWRKL